MSYAVGAQEGSWPGLAWLDFVCGGWRSEIIAWETLLLQNKATGLHPGREWYLGSSMSWERGEAWSLSVCLSLSHTHRLDILHTHIYTHHKSNTLGIHIFTHKHTHSHTSYTQHTLSTHHTLSSHRSHTSPGGLDVCMCVKLLTMSFPGSGLPSWEP